MKFTFELPVRKPEDYSSIIVDKRDSMVAMIEQPDDVDYIVHVINSHKKLVELLRASTNILTALMQEHKIVDTDCPTTFSHYTLQKLTRQRKANKQALEGE